MTYITPAQASTNWLSSSISWLSMSYSLPIGTVQTKDTAPKTANQQPGGLHRLPQQSLYLLQITDLSVPRRINPRSGTRSHGGHLIAVVSSHRSRTGDLSL